MQRVYDAGRAKKSFFFFSRNAVSSSMRPNHNNLDRVTKKGYLGYMLHELNEISVYS